MARDKGSPYQEQEQEQEQEPETTVVANPGVSCAPAREREAVVAVAVADQGAGFGNGDGNSPPADAISSLGGGPIGGCDGGTPPGGGFSAGPSGPRRPLPSVIREAEARDRGEYFHGETRLRPGELWAELVSDFADARGAVYAGGFGPRGEFQQEFLPWYREVIPPHLDLGDDLNMLHAEVREVWEFYMKHHRSKGPPRVGGLCKAWNHYRDLYARVKFDDTPEEAAG
jgi:hypothetical protein